MLRYHANRVPAEEAEDVGPVLIVMKLKRSSGLHNGQASIVSGHSLEFEIFIYDSVLTPMIEI